MNPQIRRPLALERGGRETGTGTAAEDVTTKAVTRTLGALRLLRYVRGSREHQEAVLRSALRRLREATAAIEQRVRELAA